MKIVAESKYWLDYQVIFGLLGQNGQKTEQKINPLLLFGPF